MGTSGADALQRYRSKRNFAATAEPRGGSAVTAGAGEFVIQKHRARRLHYDLRLELDGVLLSWAVPKGPSFDPADKRMAIHVEDHPLEYARFEGTIAPGQYGAGEVIVWDKGTWSPLVNARDGLRDGKLVFELHGHKLHGAWELVRIAKPGDKQDAWLLFKKKDRFARPHAEFDVVSARPDSVAALPPAATDDTEPVLSDAPKAALPATLSPQLATLATAAPSSGEWSWEIKLDGYRLLTRVRAGRVSLFTRGGHDWTAKMPELAAELKTLALHSAWLDGEIVVLGESGMPDFGALQDALDSADRKRIVYFVFDLPYFEGHDLRTMPLRWRRRLLENFLRDKTTERIRFSAAFDADAAAVQTSARRLGLEGLIAKRIDSPYESKRSESWLKLKNRQRQEFVIAGYTDRASGEAQIGSLLLGMHDADGKLRSVGSVGTGWSAAAAQRLQQRLQQIEVPKPPFADGAPTKNTRWTAASLAEVHWVRAQLVAEVEFSNWTADAQLRHASFVSLREDKDASQVMREQPLPLPTTAPPTVQGITVSHAQRIVDPDSGVTKLELVRYYESVAERLLVHLKARPCSVVRAPTGVGGKLFFQKHADALGVPQLRELDAALWPGHAALFEVPDAQALLALAQMNVIEFHTWNATSRRLDKPDRVVFDLDPGEGVAWQQVQEAATLTRGLLDELGLASWLKTSGGKGLHVVVPLTPRADWRGVHDFARRFVQHLAKVIPGRFVSRSGPSRRVGRIFVDYLRNGFGATTVAAYSARARPGLGVSMPLAWDELDGLQRSDQWHVRSAHERLSFQAVDPWHDYFSARQTLTRAAKTLDRAS